MMIWTLLYQDLKLKVVKQAKRVIDDMAARIAKVKGHHAIQEQYWDKHKARDFEAITALQDQVQVLDHQRLALKAKVDADRKAEATTKSQAKK